MGIFPRGAQPTNPLRTAVLETNRLLAQRFANTPQLTYLDIGQQFLTPDGSLPATIMSDGVHPTDAGYQHWADALKNTGIHP